MADTGFGLPSSDDFERDTERLNLTLADSARVGYGMAQGVDADYYADAARLAKATGRPIDLVMSNPAEAKAQQAVEAVDFDAMAQVAPHTAKILADIDKAKLVGNDVDQIQGVEKSWRERAVDRIGQPVMRGLISADKLFNSALYLSGVTAKLDTYEQQYQENIGSTSTVADREARRQAGFTKESMRYESTDKAIQEGKQQIAASNGVGEALVAYLMNPAATADMFIENTAMMVPTLAVTGAAGLVAGPFGTATAAASTSYMIEYSSTVLGEMEDRGVDMRDPLQIAAAYQNPELMAAARLKATKRGVAVATFDAISGGLAGKFLKTVGPKATVRQTLMASAKEGGAQVALGMGGEAYGQIVTDDYSASDLLAEGLFELPGGATEVLSNTKHARRYNQWVDSETERIDQAAKTKVQFDKLADMAKADKVLARAPEIVEEIVQNATEDSDGSHIYVSANALNQSGLAAQVAEASPTVAAEIAQATQDNGLIAIPAAEYATKIAPMQWANEFNDHIKATPDDYSPAEAKQVIAENGAQLRADFDAAMVGIDADAAMMQSMDTVKAQIAEAIAATGRATTATSEATAMAFASYYATRAKQLGETPEALYARQPVKFQAADKIAADGQLLQQSAGGAVSGSIPRHVFEGEFDVRSAADDLAARIKRMGKSVTVTHSGSAAGKSSYLSVAGLANEIRISDHSKGAFNSQFYTPVSDNASLQQVYDSLLGQFGNEQTEGELAQTMAARQQAIHQSEYDDFQANKAKRVKSGLKKLARGKAATKSEAEALFADGLLQQDHPQFAAASEAVAIMMSGIAPAKTPEQVLADEYTAAEAAAGGRAAYDAAKADGKTKLSYGQWVQVRTPAFKAWFGDWQNDAANASKVLDAKTKEPQVIFHGTPDVRGILKDGFQAGMRGAVHFAAASQSVADSYADPKRAWDYQAAEQHTIPLFVNIRNPFEVNAAGKHWKETERHVKEAQAAGHDGIIITNSIDYYNNTPKSQATTVYAWFGDTAAKSAIDGQLLSRNDRQPIEGAVGNSGAFDASNPNILKQSQSSDSAEANLNEWAGNAPVVTSAEAGEHDFKTGAPVRLEAYHGTGRPDRVGTTFKKSRATSGPMAYFTSSPTLASGYAEGKKDTSLTDEDQSMENWFQYKPKGSRSTVSIDRAWVSLDAETKATIRERMADIRSDDDGNVIYEKGGGDIGNYAWELSQTQRGYDRSGNPLKAAVESWLNSGHLYGEEEKFQTVLKLAGFPVSALEYKHPHETQPFVYKTWVKMNSPLVVSDVPASVEAALDAAAKKDRSKADTSGADMWDKRTRTLKEWVAMYHETKEKDHQYVWTSIPDKVTAIFKAQGYDGIIDWSGKGGGFSAPVYIPFEQNQVKSAIGNKGDYSLKNDNILKQGDAQPLGVFDPDSFTIALLSGANLSTVLHEGAHFFFENDATLAQQIVGQAEAFGYDGLTEGEKQILSDVSAMFKWFGIEGTITEQLNHWNSQDREARNNQHEQMAESFEQYLLEGKAPSLELQSYFGKFRAWMLSVYKSLARQLAQNPRAGALNDEVRGIFDRMLASDEQIAMAQMARGMGALFTSPEQGGMTPKEFADYQTQGAAQTEDAVATMQAKGMKDLAWLQRTRNKKIKALQKEANALRAEARNEARRVVMSEPIYQAWQLLTAKMTKEDKLPAKPRVTTQENMLDAMANLGGMNESELKSLYGVDRKNYPLKNTVFGKPVIRKSGGISVDYMGQLLAENGYLALNEEGQYDDADFEAKLMDSLAGIDQYSYFHDYGQEEFRAGDQVANPSALAAARLDGEELRAMGTVTDVQIEYLRKLGMVSNNGLHPDIVTNIIEGFSSGDELVQELLEAQDPNAMIEAMVDQAMIERHGELSSPQAIEQAADAAVFNEARVRFAANEANALAKATGKRKVLLDAAKDFARERIARTLIRDLRPAKYAAASGVAAKEAAAAMKRGDTEQAAAQKRNEVMQSTAAKEAFDAKEEVTKAIAYFKRIQASKSIATDALIQIEELLGKYDLRVSQSLKAIDRKTSMVEYVKAQIKDGNLPDIGAEMLDPVARASYEALTSEVNDLGEVVYADDADRIELLAGYLDAAESTHYKNMTVEQLRGLRDTVEQIAHIGGLKNRLLNKQEKRSLDEAKQEISESIIANARKDGQLQPTRGTKYERAMGAVKRYVSAHIRMASRAFVIDGGKDNGAFWRYFILPANQATDKESSLNIEITTKLHAIMKPLMPRARSLERLNSSKYYKTLGTSLNWENRFAILLNMGNESNTQRLVSGGVNGKGSVTLGAVMDVMSEFSEAEILAAQQVWDLFESLRPQIAELEVATKGREPNWIPPRPLTVKSKEGKLVTLRGGYYPVVYDHGINIRAAEDLADSNANIEKRAARATATTRQSFVKARVAEVHNRPLLLTLDSLFGGFADVVHDLSWREYAIDTSKLLKSKRIRDAIGEHHGMETWQQLTSFTKDLVAGVPRQNDGVAAATAFIRKNVAMAGLGLNLINWMQQPFGVFNGVPRLGGGREGWKWIGRGMTKYFANPAKATREMRASSEFMEARGRTRFRELNEISNQIRGQTVGSQIAPYLISGMIFTQTIADTIVWHAMVEKAYTDNPSLTEERAHAMGDQAVRDSQGGGQQVDLSTMERQKDGFLKLFTVFMSFMNTSNNLAYMSAKTGRSKAAKIGDLFVVFMIPVLSTALLKGLVIPSGDDDDDGKWIEDLALDLATFPLSGFIVLREIVPAIAAFSGAGYGGDYKGPAGTRLISDLVSFGKQANQGELDDPFRKAFVNLMGSGFGLPAAQINRTITGAKALDEGATENPAALVFGFKR